MRAAHVVLLLMAASVATMVMSSRITSGIANRTVGSNSKGSGGGVKTQLATPAPPTPKMMTNPSGLDSPIFKEGTTGGPRKIDDSLNGELPFLPANDVELPSELTDASSSAFHPDPTPWLVVSAIPTVDTPVGRQRRAAQRDSWFGYSSVVNKKVNRRRSGDDDGTDNQGGIDASLLVRYLLARHPSNPNWAFTSDLKQEAKLHGDVLAMEMKEGRPSSSKASGSSGYWGPEAEVGMSRKAFVWFHLAPRVYPNARYFAKMDDDMFLRVPQYLFDLTQRIPKAKPESNAVAVKSGSSSSSASKVKNSTALPLYWGKMMRWGARKGDPKSKFLFAGGMCLTMDRSLSTRLGDDPRFELLRSNVYDETRKTEYKSYNMDHEDVMMGRVFYDGHVPMRYVKDCRLHDVHTGANVKPITDKSLAIHHVKMDEYATLMKRFAEGTVLASGELAVSTYPESSEIVKIC